MGCIFGLSSPNQRQRLRPCLRLLYWLPQLSIGPWAASRFVDPRHGNTEGRRIAMMRSSWFLRTAFFAALAFTLVMAWLPHPPQIPGNPEDKVQHIAAFLALSLLGAMAFPKASLFRLAERLSFLGALIEVVQNIPALHRDCDIMDWAADTAAVAVMLVLVRVWRARRSGGTAMPASRFVTARPWRFTLKR